MVVVKFFVKILLLPCWLVLTVLIWFGLFITSFSSVLIWLLSGLFFFVAVFSWIATLATGTEVMQMLMIGFVAFALPFVAVKALTIVDALRSWVGDFIRS